MAERPWLAWDGLAIRPTSWGRLSSLPPLERAAPGRADMDVCPTGTDGLAIRPTMSRWGDSP
ncbi:MAG: hypothetical protein WD069_11090 [Planctomycetales bacterium]